MSKEIKYINLVYRGETALEQAFVRTNLVSETERYLKRAKETLGRNELTFDEQNRCARRAVISAAPEWQIIHEIVHERGVNTFKRVIEKLGGTIIT